MGIVIAHGVPVYDTVEFSAFTSIVHLHGEWQRHLPFASQLAPVFCKTQPVHVARESIVAAAINAYRADVVLFQDSDISVEPEQAALLVQTLLEAPDDVGLVGAPCAMRLRHGGKFADNVWPLKDADGCPYGYRTDAPFECAAIGFGLVAIRREVFEVVTRPWFRFESDENGVLRVGEDVGFCDRIRQSWRWKVLCEPRVRPRHHFRVGVGLGSGDRLLAEMLSHTEDEA